MFNSPIPLLPGVSNTATYRWTSGDGLEVESVLPDGSIPAEDVLGRSQGGAHQTVSTDGSRVYFSLGSGAYLREGGQTRAISISQVPGDPQTVMPANVALISKDGRFAFLSSNARLTPDAPEAGAKLYRYDASNDELQYLATLPHTGSEMILGGSSDGQTVYYNERGETSDNQPATYVSVWRNGAAHQIAVAPQELQRASASVSPNGRYLAYEDLRPIFESDPESDVYAYDADADQLACISCLEGGKSGMARLPNSEPIVSNQTGQAVDDQGRVFFDSAMRLLPADANGEWDVYMYQAGALSLISPGSAPYSARLLGIARDGEDVFFSTAQGLVGQDRDEAIDIYDARVGGGFAKQNPEPVPACAGESCQGGHATPPPVARTASEAVGSLGNRARKHCGKGKKARRVKGKVRCVKKQQTRSGRRAGPHRRIGR